MEIRHYVFDLEFQKYLLASFLADEKFTREHLGVFHPEFFGDDLLSGIAQGVREFFEKNGELPSKETLLNDIKGLVEPGRKLMEYQEVIEEVYEKVGINTSYYQEKAIEFAKVHITHNAVRNASILVEQGEVEEAWKELSEAQKQAEAIHQDGFYDFFKEIAGRALRYFNQKQGKADVERIPTGFPPLDERLQGGLGPGETGVILAPPKHGKTTTLISMAVQAIIREKKVLYITLELSKVAVAVKFDSNFTGHGLDILRKKPKSFQEEMEKISERLRGGLTIVEFPTKSLTLPQLQSTIERVKPEVVFLDYASIMRSRDRDQRRFELSDLHEGLRRVAGECKIPIWTAHQANRPGLGTKIVEMEHISEDLNIAAICDIVLSVNQTPDEKRQGVLRFYVVGNRLGSSGEMILCNVDWSLSKITPAWQVEDI